MVSLDVDVSIMSDSKVGGEDDDDSSSVLAEDSIGEIHEVQPKCVYIEGTLCNTFVHISYAYSTSQKTFPKPFAVLLFRFA